MGEKPILFNTSMVRAILNGSKTQTRRLIKRRYDNTVLEMKTDKYGARLIEIQKDEEGVTFGKHEDGSTWRKLRAYIEPQPAYKTGDVLYVRETWTEDGRSFYYRADFESDWLDPCETLSGGYPIYCSYHPECEGCTREKQRIHWHPSIHMLKDAARIWLRVTDVRLQRLQDISYDDVQAEGMDMDEWYEYDEWQHQTGDGLAADGISVKYETMRGFFGHKVWDATMQSLEQYEEYGWDANPWVWAYTFERIDNPREAKA